MCNGGRGSTAARIPPSFVNRPGSRDDQHTDTMRRPADQNAERTLDELLVLSCHGGSSAAFAALHRRWHQKLLAHASYLLGRSCRDRAEDVCQEAWLAIARGLPALVEPSHFRAWAYAIVTRRVADLRRKMGRSARVVDELRAESESANRSGATGDSSSGDPSGHQEQLRIALAQLSSDDRALLRLFYLDELSVAETAEALDIPAGTVKSRLFHARQRLRRALQRKPL